MFWKKSKWSRVPGCFERHLQRRDGNVLFPEGRRNICNDEIAKARERDEIEQARFGAKMREEINQMKIQQAFEEVSTFLQNHQVLMEEAAGIGGKALDMMPIMEQIEDDLINKLNGEMPEGAELLKKAQSHSAILRTPFFAQMKRKDTPILEIEQVPALLCEDLSTIAVMGLCSRSFPNFEPSDTDIKKHLDEAIFRGFNLDQAQQIIRAWYERPGIQIHSI